MSQPHNLESMTVLELRKLARENHIQLPGGSTKADIVGIIGAALGKGSIGASPLTPLENAASQHSDTAEAEETKATERRRAATIIADEGDEPVSIAPQAPPRPQPDKTRTSSGKPKPVFTLQGSRAWHNPQPFNSAQQQARTAPPPAFGVAGPLRDAATSEASRFKPPATRLAPPRPSRFGPATTPDVDAQDAIPEPRLYPSLAAPQQPRPAPYQSGAYRSVLPAAQPGVTEASAMPEVSLPELEMQLSESTARDRLNPAVPEMLAAGDVGDGAGVLEIQPDGYGFLRAGNLLPGRADVYVSGTQIRRFRLRNGDYVSGKTRPQREGDRYAAMLFITGINGEEPDAAPKFAPAEGGPRREFDQLTPTYPTRRINLSSREENDMVLRLIDLFVPIGFGQRAMIVAAPKTGKTTILKKIALSLKRNHPDVHSIMLLVDERPEEVTDLKETVGGDIFHSTFDEPAESHAKVSELTLERAMRLVEAGKDVVILLDSLTRLSRAYNTLMPGSARVMTGGLAAGAMNKPKRFFGAARNLKEGGSLTIIATALVDTGSRMDGVIFEEFKGTGNMELTLDRQLSERRLFPAVSLAQSGTRHEELLLTPKELEVTAKIRDRASFTSEQESMALLLSMMEKSRDNDEFVARYDDWMKLMRGTN